MLETNSDQLKRELLKDFYRLTKMIEKETYETKLLDIVTSIQFIDEMLNNYCMVYSDQYDFNKMYIKYNKYFKREIHNELLEVKHRINQLKNNIDIYKTIHNTSREVIKNFKIFKDSVNITPTNLTKEEFYSILFSLPYDQFTDHIKKQFTSKKVYIDVADDYDEIFSNGMEYSLKPLKKHYHVVESKNKYSYLSIFSAIHELSHSYVKNTYNTDTTFNIFGEVVPYLNEFKTIDYLINNDKGINDSIINFQGIIINLKKCYNHKFKLSNYKTYNLQQYNIGELVAFNFYEMYKSDENAYKYYLDYFCKNIDIIEPIELLKKSNISLDSLTSGDTSKRLIKKYIEDYTKIKS